MGDLYGGLTSALAWAAPAPLYPSLATVGPEAQCRTILAFLCTFLGWLLPMALHAAQESALYVAFVAGQRQRGGSIPRGGLHDAYFYVHSALSPLGVLHGALLALCAAGGAWAAAALVYAF